MTENKASKVSEKKSPSLGPVAESADPAVKPAPETGGRGGPDPTRYGDWEKNGRCVDF
jgi:hypothetical protein